MSRLRSGWLLPAAITVSVAALFGVGFALWLSDVSDDAEAGRGSAASARAPEREGARKPAAKPEPPATTPTPSPAPASKPSFAPADVEVSVLSGVGVPGAAKRTGKEVTREGFALGVVDNAAEPSAVSLVLYRAGQERAALAVSRQLGITQRKPVDRRNGRTAKDADVVVIVGGDRVR